MSTIEIAEPAAERGISIDRRRIGSLFVAEHIPAGDPFAPANVRSIR
jgi:hypothetical protein